MNCSRASICSISSVSIYYATESDLRVKSYDHLEFSRAFVVQFRASRYIMRLNRTSELKVMTIWNSRELPLFNFEHPDIMRLNLTSELKVMTIWISRQLPLIDFESHYMWCARIVPPIEKYWPFEFLENFCCSISSVSIFDATESYLRLKSNDHLNFSRASDVQLFASRYIMRLNMTSVWKVMTNLISRELPLFNFLRLDILCARIWPPSEK